MFIFLNEGINTQQLISIFLHFFKINFCKAFLGGNCDVFLQQETHELSHV